jgi:hypothetical protein
MCRFYTPTKGTDMKDDIEIVRRIEAIEQMLSVGLVTLIALVQRLPRDHDYDGLVAAQLDDAAELMQRNAKAMGRKFPST